LVVEEEKIMSVKNFSNRDTYESGDIVQYANGYWKANREVTPPMFPSIMDGDRPGDSDAWSRASITEVIHGKGGGGGGHGGGGHGGGGWGGGHHGGGRGGFVGPWGWGGGYWDGPEWVVTTPCLEFDDAGNCVIFGANSPIGRHLKKLAKGR
jgi:hypothetical protein